MSVWKNPHRLIISAGPNGGPEGHVRLEEAKCALKMIKKNFFSCTAERKGGGGVGTDRAVTPACKGWDFKSPVIWSRRIEHCCTFPNKTRKQGGTYPQSQAWTVAKMSQMCPLFHSIVACIANSMWSGHKANSCAPSPDQSQILKESPSP